MNPPPMPPSSPSIPYAMYDQTRAADDSHLKLLSIFYYIVAGLTALFSCIFLIHIAIGIAVLSGKMPMNNANNPPPPGFDKAFGSIFIVIGSLAILFGWTMAVMNFIVARSLRARKRRLLILIIAGLNCASVPIGTILGVFTFVVMFRPSVESEFRANQVLPAPAT